MGASHAVGIDIDHRINGVGPLLMGSIGAEARQMGIETLLGLKF